MKWMAVALGLWGAPAGAFTGNDLLELCKPSLTEHRFCSGFALAIMDATFDEWHRSNSDWNLSLGRQPDEKNFRPRPFCVGPGVTNKQALRVLEKFINENPEKTHMYASQLLRAALADAFPCK